MELTNWKNLKSMLCPKCNLPLKRANATSFECENYPLKCDFWIREERFNQLVRGMYRSAARDGDQDAIKNLEGLNNL